MLDSSNFLVFFRKGSVQSTLNPKTFSVFSNSAVLCAHSLWGKFDFARRFWSATFPGCPVLPRFHPFSIQNFFRVTEQVPFIIRLFIRLQLIDSSFFYIELCTVPLSLFFPTIAEMLKKSFPWNRGGGLLNFWKGRPTSSVISSGIPCILWPLPLQLFTRLRSVSRATSVIHWRRR